VAADEAAAVVVIQAAISKSTPAKSKNEAPPVLGGAFGFDTAAYSSSPKSLPVFLAPGEVRELTEMSCWQPNVSLSLGLRERIAFRVLPYHPE
jgi:hypothetical protein